MVDVTDPIDQTIVDYVVASLKTHPVHAFILKVDSPGASSGDLAPMFDAVMGAEAPVVAWIGPSPAVAYGGAAYLVNHADVRSAAPGTKVGFLSPAVLRSGAESPSMRPGDDPGLVVATVDVLAHATATVDVDDPVVAGFVDRVDPALGQLIVGLDGETIVRDDRVFVLDTAATSVVDGREVTVAARPVRFMKPGWLDRFVRLGARPDTAFLFFVFAMAFAAFEFYAAGSGLMAAVSGLSMIVAGYGLATLPVFWPGVAMVIVGFGLLVWAFNQHRLGWRVVVGGIMVPVGGLLFASTRPGYPPAVWLVAVSSLAAGVFTWYALTTVVRGRFATPTVGREELVGRRCVVVDTLDPTGIVLVDGTRWRATADRGIRIEAGAPAEIVGLSGLVLDIDPIGPMGG